MSYDERTIVATSHKSARCVPLFEFVSILSRTHRAIRVPPIERSHALHRQRIAGFVPAAGPFCRIAQLAFRVLSAAGNEAREGAAASGLADRVVAQVEA